MDAKQLAYFNIYCYYIYIANSLPEKIGENKSKAIFRIPLIVWNALMAVFSTIGVIRCLPQFIQILTTKGLIASYCQADFAWDARLHIWYHIFIMSKAVELLDTMFIVLRGGKLIYLHWVHHVLNMCILWYAHDDVSATAHWVVNMNFLVHSLMYTYYAVTAKGIHIHINIMTRISITILQIVQMGFGVIIHFYVLHRKLNGQPCDVSLSVVIAGSFLYNRPFQSNAGYTLCELSQKRLIIEISNFAII